MQLAKFRHTGLTVSRLCLGTATFGKQTDEAESHRILDTAADSGSTFSIPSISIPWATRTRSSAA